MRARFRRLRRIPAMTQGRHAAPLVVALALLVLYLVWGSTYLAIRFALQGYPPLFFPALRFLFAGALLYAVLRLRGAPNPSLRQWRNAVVIGVLLLNVGNGFVVFAERAVGSALAATAIATVPLWAALFGGLWGVWPRGAQWLGLLLGFAGIVMLNLGGDFAANPAAAALLMTAALSWAFGSIWSRRLDLPSGLMSSACQMFAAGVIFLAGSYAAGESWQLRAAPQALAAMLYLAVFGSVLAFSAYMYLVQNVSPALAMSYAYINPVVALGLGATLGHEKFVASDFLAIALVLAGVVLIMLYNRAERSKKF